MAPEIHNSTKEEREDFIKKQYKCIGNCDSCGICAVFHGKDPVTVFEEYINGTKDYLEVCSETRSTRN